MTRTPPRTLRRPVSAAEVRAAEAAVARADAEWGRAARRTVSDAELADARRNVDHCRGAVARLSPARLGVTRVVVAALAAAERARQLGEWLGRAAGTAGRWWPATAVLVGLTAGVPAALAAAAVRPSAGGLLLAVAAAVAVAGGGAAGLLCPAAGRRLPAVYHRRRAELVGSTRTAAAAAKLLADWRKQLDDLQWVRAAEDRAAAARRELAEVRAVLADERYRLLHSDWRSLRGVPFEQFLERVFANLGYQTRATAVTGDQGIDLILDGKGTTVAVQAKGYGGSVGNKSVQEAYAGMTYYGCRRCVVVTNSSFTRGGVSLAARVGCLLIDGSRIPDLIEGKIL